MAVRKLGKHTPPFFTNQATTNDPNFKFFHQPTPKFIWFFLEDIDLKIKETSNNPQFVTPAPYPVRGKLRRESSNVKSLWIPAFAGMTFLEVALSQRGFWVNRGSKVKRIYQ